MLTGQLYSCRFFHPSSTNTEVHRPLLASQVGYHENFDRMLEEDCPPLVPSAKQR